MRPAVALLMLLLFNFLVDSVDASHIRMDSALTAGVEGKFLNISCTSLNKGDEPAYDVRAIFTVAGRKLPAEKIKVLPAGGTYRDSVRMPLDMNRTGEYPLVMELHYTDANRYPFSALTVHTFQIGPLLPLLLFGIVKPLAVSEEGTLAATLKNFGDRELKIETVLLTPRELSVKEEKLPCKVAAYSQQEIVFSVRNLTARPGSRYRVYMVSEFDQGDYHHTSIASGEIAIHDERPGGQYRYIFVSLGAFLAIIFIMLWFHREKFLRK